jgi:purine-binding chemotaxis protein CheW
MRREAVSAEWMTATDRAAELRRAFDRSFAEAPRSDVVRLEDLLEIRVGATPYAMRITEISGLFAGRTITPLPTTVPELLGITGFRGAVLPVYDLGALLGYPMEAKPRWLAIAAGMPVGLAFERFERHVRIRRDAIVPHGRRDSPVRHVHEVFQVQDRGRGIVSVASVLEAITSRVRAGAPKRER